MRRLTKWLVVSGFVGTSVAVVIYILGGIPAMRANIVFNPYVMLTLAPAMILGLAEPTSLGHTLFLFGIVLCTNFALYGLVGFILWGVWSVFRKRAAS